MALAIKTESGHALPPHQRHAITAHLPFWSQTVRWLNGDTEVPNSLQSYYPRLALHRDVKGLVNRVLEKAGTSEEQSCLLFSNVDAAVACREFAITALPGKDGILAEEVNIRYFSSCIYLYAVFFPAAKRSAIQPFWSQTGTGISSRLAEACLERLNMLQEISEASTMPCIHECEAHSRIRERIADLMERAPIGPPREAKVSPDDVYLYPTGMTAIYAVHLYLLKQKPGTTVLFGFPFKATNMLFENFGPGCKLFGLGNAQELDELEHLLEKEVASGLRISIQAVWTEVPANPMLTTADLKALRRLADKYDFPLIVDDTIGSFCNLDVLGVADIVITSLTKSFSGYADVMGGSVVLNPSSKRYADFKQMFENFSNDYWIGDAEVLERNSRDYLSRSSVLNSNAENLVDHLQTYALDPKSTLSRIYYPSVNADRPDYEAFMRPKTESFTPGYGCLFSLEFESTEAAIVFHDNLHVHKGPHLGAHLTLAMPYVMSLFPKQLAWASKYGLKESQIRVSVGLEGFESLKVVFDAAMGAANDDVTGMSQEDAKE